ncbi:hypothetical protein ANOM_005179 [Aspergillus nomiae NRRL 13137]|uniref:Inositol hexakisphosphate and diphosphoinositol-pentakisphosphate kinase n=1 Tax=Aspergillus nomiae NRRL (strain ATCC 15546 / NRRL 13137 / CBS 260.88 / M93) TaxID=1509407 RepID=A0A0L1J4U8_ASPN3|nr:uncharacterized protein ANOM_005179 [Aspergillus nomiae NRRL 13137]KNG86710.1 hypothetical protein ANOM_005179 [Aspergillus nomiae NRRL 13137]
MSALYKLAAVNNGPETSWDDNHMRLLARLTDEEIEILQLPSPKCSAKRISAELCQTPAQKDRVMSPPWRLGICAMEDKALSKANQEIFRRLQIDGLIEVVLFGDKTLLSKKPEEWPVCDFLVAFYSDGFPLEKVVSYTRLRSPFCYNDLLMQGVLFDRRLCNRVLDHLGVRTPKRLEVNRDGGPRAHDWGLVQHVYDRIGLGIPGPAEGEAARERSHAPSVSLSDDGNTLLVDGRTLHKPFVEKPVSAEDHNIYIYFPTTPQGTGGGRRLFRKVGNKCSEYDPDLVVPRCITEQGMTSSYVYEPLLNADNGEDVKAYAVGPSTVLRGKEVRLPTEVSKEEADAAAKISTGFGQSVCGFDIVRNKGKSYVIDVNGWTSVKNQPSFYGQCADILQQMLMSRVAHGIAKN